MSQITSPLTSNPPAHGATDRRIAVIGLGYVGLPLTLEFIGAGFDVIGLDANEERVGRLLGADSPIDDVTNDRLADGLRAGLRIVGLEGDAIAEADGIIICVPTPITAARDPDLRHVLDAAGFVGRHLKTGQLVILQSTTYPGTTMGPFRERLEETSGLVAGRNFDLAFAPERVSPGDPATVGRDIPRLVGGITTAATARTAAIFRSISATVIEVSSPDVAELAKLHENIFRNVNIALVNQLALMCERMSIDVWEVIDAAATKPFGFMPFRPGPGVGGHCIPVDPYYLSWRARQFGFFDRFVELAGDINMSMPRHVIDLIGVALNARGRSLNGAKVGVLGVAFKPNIHDARNAPAADVIALLRERGAGVTYHDPHVKSFRDAKGYRLTSADLAEVIGGSDLVVAMVAHRAIDWPAVYAAASLVVDTADTSRGHAVRADQVLLLGSGWVVPVEIPPTA